MLPLYAVIGNPIAHSLSPVIQMAFARQFNIQMRYERIRVPLNSFDYTLNQLSQQGLEGCNITVPFKLKAFEYAKHATARATLAQATNCFIKIKNNHTWLADNTDGTGLIADLCRLTHSQNLAGARVLIIGAGGATQGCIAPLLEAGATLHITNRTAHKAFDLVKQFQINTALLDKNKDNHNDLNINLLSHTQLFAHGLQDTVPVCDIVINATSGSLNNEKVIPNAGSMNAMIKPTLAYDMMYSKDPTPFMRYAQSQGATTFDGLGMLIEQAADSFYLWHQIRPDTTVLHQTLRHR